MEGIMAYDFVGRDYIQYISRNPIDYYWEQMEKSLDTMTRLQKDKNSYIEFLNENLLKHARELNVDVKDRKMHYDYCFKACQLVLLEQIYLNGRACSTGYAWEFFVCGKNAFELGNKQRTVNLDQNSFYNQLLNTLEDAFQSEVNRNLLSAKKGTEYIAVDIDRIRRNLAEKIKIYYNNHPEKTTSTQSNPAVQKIATGIFSTLADELSDKVERANRNSYYSSPYSI
jgi:hypothetical protein